MTALRDKHILVVEDEPIVAMMVEDMLADLGALVVGPASSFEEAMALAGSARLDAALLDVNLDGKLSHGVADLLRERGVPFVFATGYGSSGYKGERETVIQKPYRRDQVAAALEKAMARR